MEGVFWPGIVAMAVMYLLVFAVGIYSSPPKGEGEPGSVDELLLAGRALPLWVGLLTMTATWVGGAYINGTAENTYRFGVTWGLQAGVGYAFSLLVGGMFYARRMREHGFTTLIDPLEDRYGKKTAALLMIPAVLAELFWSAAVLVALGTTVGTIMGLDFNVSVLVSAVVAIAYTVFGGLRAVAYTDVAQLVLILFGLCLALPFVMTAAGGWDVVAAKGMGDAGFSDPHTAINYGDWMIILVFGGIPWNVYFQRVLSAPSPGDARTLSLAAAVICAMLAVPPMLLGLAAQSVDWVALGATDAGVALGGSEAIVQQLADKPSLVLPYLLRLAVPQWVGVVGLGAVSAAVMSSVDSSILSASSLIAWNGYHRLFAPDAKPEAIARLVKVLIVALGSAATLIALTVQSVSQLWYLCGDVVFCVLFPQLTLALFDSKANRTGALAGFAVSVFLRLGGGDKTLGLPQFLPYPDWGDVDWPFRTVAMLAGLLTALVVARLSAKSDPATSLIQREV